MYEIFDLEKGKLKVLQRMSWEMAGEFECVCEDLIRAGGAFPEIDLSRAGPLSTPHVGIIMQTADRCSFYGRPLTLTVRPAQMPVFEATGFEKIGRLKVAADAESLEAGADA